jgi:hypothetical protein
METNYKTKSNKYEQKLLNQKGLNYSGGEYDPRDFNTNISFKPSNNTNYMINEIITLLDNFSDEKINLYQILNTDKYHFEQQMKELANIFDVVSNNKSNLDLRKDSMFIQKIYKDYFFLNQLRKVIVMIQQKCDNMKLTTYSKLFQSKISEFNNEKDKCNLFIPKINNILNNYDKLSNNIYSLYKII